MMSRDAHHPKQDEHPLTFTGEISRRDFLRVAGVVAAGALVAGCQKQSQPEVISNPSSGTPQAKVAIALAKTYDRDTIKKAVIDLVDQLGGISSVVKRGDIVAIKPNLTGGVSSASLPGVKAIESYITHPEVVRALGELALAAGAKKVYIVESVYEWESYTQWGYEEVAASLEATLIDLNDSKPSSDFVEVPVGEGSFIYPKFKFNQILQDVNVFMSVSKMKNHYNAGVTHTMKNLFGCAPAHFYNLAPSDNIRTGFHGQANETRTRLPRVIVDLNRARPIHFALIDGIMTAEAGEGPWISTMTPVAPGVLIAGKSALATDAVATAVMGFDPTANYPDAPFLRCDNHLNLAAAAGLGTNRLSEIEVVGAAIKDVRYQFTPAK
jgi:uncharacterized protein (DUF362 family)